jgi:GT2 family glycosyltransferase
MRDGATEIHVLPPPEEVARPTVRGKFIFLGEQKFYVRGVTYGPFRPGEEHAADLIERDFAAMARNGVNAVRTYTVPSRGLLDIAWRYGLRVMVGLPWEQHVAFLDEKGRPDAIEERVRAGVRACASHPAVLCYAIGNEIPASIVRWHGRKRVACFLERLYHAAKAEDPDGLVTYVNYPSTEYLRLPFLDFVCFNIFLESQRPFEQYLARLQNIAGDRPLLVTELGLDSLRHGEQEQARALDWQVRSAFSSGCAGAFVFAWTDEWHRGGHEIEDWDFGLTDRERRPKPALAATRSAFAQTPVSAEGPHPRISVVVCTRNGAATLQDCLEGIARLEYPDVETIVVDDGSTDATAAVVGQHDVRLIETESRGLGRARNLGLAAATGEIVAYIDDDARPDPHWLTYLAHTFATTPHAGVGGPSAPHPGDGEFARCVANVPGGPTHVLLTDVEAEHIPGCNMAFRKSALEEIGGFDPQFETAGDDVDVCWRIRDRGWTLGFSPGAVVWHHRRSSIRAFWKQQRGYGRAEALLERKWPERYSGAGHVSWVGRLYANGGSPDSPPGRWRIYYGTWGSGLFQSLYEPQAAGWRFLPRMPEWYLLIFTLAVISAAGLLWKPLLAALALLGLALGALVVEAVLGAVAAPPIGLPESPLRRLKVRGLTAFLFLIQPLARLRGRLEGGLTPWRRRSAAGFAFPRPRTSDAWSELWEPAESRLSALQATLHARRLPVLRGGDFDRWDLEVRGGALGAVRIRVAVEEHGAGRQLERIRSSPRWSPAGLFLTALAAALTVSAGIANAWIACGLLGLTALVLAARGVRDCGVAAAVVRDSLELRGARAPTIVRAVLPAERTRA